MHGWCDCWCVRVEGQLRDDMVLHSTRAATWTFQPHACYVGRQPGHDPAGKYLTVWRFLAKPFNTLEGGVGALEIPTCRMRCQLRNSAVRPCNIVLSQLVIHGSLTPVASLAIGK